MKFKNASSGFIAGFLFAISVTEEERDANARLIASAPDLLNALRAMLVAVDDSTDTLPGHFIGQSEAYLNTVAIPRAKAALKKAEGHNEVQRPDA